MDLRGGRISGGSRPGGHDTVSAAYLLTGIGLGVATAALLVSGSDLPIEAALIVGCCFVALTIIGWVAWVTG